MSRAIDSLDLTLEELFRRRVTQLAPPLSSQQIGFQPPDRNWRSVVKGLVTKLALNVYLVDLREHRGLRSTDKVRVPPAPQNGFVYEQVAPMRVECHYLVTAWSPAQSPDARTRLEHALISEVLGVLAGMPSLVPRRVFRLGDPVPNGFPGVFADSELPVTVTPAEGFPKLAEFWGTMTGSERPWKPAVYLVVTVPISLDESFTGTEVTTLFSEHRVGFEANGNETPIQIGGHVRDRWGNLVRGAWVQLEPAGGGDVLQRTTSNDGGEFTFVRLDVGTYSLRSGGPDGGGVFVTPVDVPSRTGRYDLRFS